jgi:hypothetical protein
MGVCKKTCQRLKLFLIPNLFIFILFCRYRTRPNIFLALFFLSFVFKNKTMLVSRPQTPKSQIEGDDFVPHTQQIGKNKYRIIILLHTYANVCIAKKTALVLHFHSHTEVQPRMAQKIINFNNQYFPPKVFPNTLVPHFTCRIRWIIRGIVCALVYTLFSTRLYIVFHPNNLNKLYFTRTCYAR